MDPGKYEIFLSFPLEFPPVSVYTCAYIHVYIYVGLYRFDEQSRDLLAS